MGYQNVPANWAGKAAWYRTQINNQIGSAGANIQLMETEFNCDLGNKQSTSLVSGLWVADAVAGLMQTDFKVALQWDLTNGYNALSADSSHYGWREGSDDGLISTGTNNASNIGTIHSLPRILRRAATVQDHAEWRPGRKCQQQRL